MCLEGVFVSPYTFTESSPTKPIFGMALEQHLQLMGRDISLVLEACILTLLDTGLEEEVRGTPIS